MRWQWLKARHGWLVLGAILALPLGCVCINWWMVGAFAPQVFNELERLPANDVALVLGTSART
jgi:vancomycin permeability regulator SanA